MGTIIRNFLVVFCTIAFLSCGRSGDSRNGQAETAMQDAAVIELPETVLPEIVLPEAEVLSGTIYANAPEDLPLEAEDFGPFPETFTNLSVITPFSQRSTVAAIGADGTLWAWESGELSEDGAYYHINPFRIGNASNWASVSLSGNRLHRRWLHGSPFLAGGESFGIRTDGSLWTWRTRGEAAFGADISDETFNVPVRIGADYHWASVFTTAGSTYAIQIDGSLWSWRHNLASYFPDLDPNAPPTRIGIATHWVFVAAGLGPTFAIRTDGTLWGWRQPRFGTGGGLGWQGSPTQMGTDTDWAYVAASMVHAVAIKTDGSLWAWGRNWYGELGDGTTTNRDIFVRVGTDYDWASVAVGDIGGAHVNVGHTLAVRTDGTLWAWGNNRWDGWHEGNPRSIHVTPVQVGRDNDWASVLTSSDVPQVLATKTDGSLWVWDTDQWGPLGDDSGYRRPARLVIESPQAAEEENA